MFQFSVHNFTTSNCLLHERCPVRSLFACNTSGFLFPLLVGNYQIIIVKLYFKSYDNTLFGDFKLFAYCFSPIDILLVYL